MMAATSVPNFPAFILQAPVDLEMQKGARWRRKDPSP
jgi:hypothetical protein